MRPLDDAPGPDELLPDLLADTRDRTDRAEATDALDAIDGALTDNIRPLTGAAAMSEECDHPGNHATGVKCPDCGRFSTHGWDTGWFSTENGGNQHWGGTCSVHGEWSESAA